MKKKEKDEKDEYEQITEPDKSEAEEGYGTPSKGQYSLDLGGYKSFGTVGQGNSSIGVKDENSDTCSERIILFTVTANEDTNKATTPTVQSTHSHPVVGSSSDSYLTFEVGNYQFLSDYTGEEEAPEEGSAAAPTEEDQYGIALRPCLIVAFLTTLLLSLS